MSDTGRRLRTRGLFGLSCAGLLWLSGCTGTVDAPLGSEGCQGCGTEGPVLPAGPDELPGVGDPNSPDGIGWSTRFARLSNAQWEQSVRDLFFFDAESDYSEGFTQEPRDKGYRNQAAAELTLAGDAWTRYQAAAERVAKDVAQNPARLAQLRTSVKAGEISNPEFIRGLGRRVFRRPLSDVEQAAYEALFSRGPELASGDALASGTQLILEAMLQSPHFLYRVESSGLSESGQRQAAVALSGFEIATRLSYALWNTTPSTALLDAAETGELGTKDGIERWARKLLADPRASESLLAFHEETFGVSSYGTQDKDPALLFDAAKLAPVLREEAARFFREVLIENKGGIGGLLTEPVAFVNESTASAYGLSDVTGEALVRRELDPAQRAGLLTQLGFLTQNATRSSTDPVHRGLLVLRKILCDEPDPPPMMFELPKMQAGATTREVYEKATACGASCHATLINPPGFAFESFDTLGRFRETEQGKPIDATGMLQIRVGYTPESKAMNPGRLLSFEGPVDMLTQLATEARVHECYARNWMRFVLNRDPHSVERGAWEALRDGSRKHDSAQELLVELTRLETFRTRVMESP